MLDVAIFIITSVFVSVGESHRHKSSSSTRQPPPWPVVPGALPFIGNLLSLQDSDQFWNTLQNWAKLYGCKHGIYEFSMFGKTRWIVLCSTEPIMKVMAKRPYKIRRASKLEKNIDGLGIGGLFSAEGATWKIERRIMAPMLNNKNVTSYFPSIKLIASRLIQKWWLSTTTDAGSSSVVVVTANIDCANCALDVVSLSLLGQDLNTLNNPTNLESRDVFNIFHILMVRNLSPIPYWKIPIIGRYIDGGGPAIDRVLGSIQRLVKDCQSKHQQKQNEDATKEKAEVEIEAEKTTLLKKLILQKNDEHLSQDRMVGNLFTLLLAGTDTSGMTITSCLWEIANDTSGLQDEIANEISKLLFDDYDINKNKLVSNTLTMDEILNGSPTLMSLYYEILRLRGPGPFFFLEPTEPFELRDGEFVTPGTILVTMNGYLRGKKRGKDGEIVSEVPTGPNGESPDEFCPRRWLVIHYNNNGKEVTTTVQAPTNKFGGFMAFGHGVRVCPGRYLAEVEILTMLTYVLGTFEIAVEKDHPPRKIVTRFTETFDGDIRLKLKPRRFF